jgi:nicotinamidase-related amidase
MPAVSTDTALLVIDAQVGLIEGFEHCWTGVLETIQDLTARARRAGVLVVFVQHCGGLGHPLEPNTPGWQLHPSLAPTADDLVVRKRSSDSFKKTPLHDELQRRGIKLLVVTGAQTELCVDATCRQAVSLDYEVTLVEDGHTTSDNAVLTAQQVIAHHHRALGQLATDGPRVVVKGSAELAF